MKRVMIGVFLMFAVAAPAAQARQAERALLAYLRVQPGTEARFLEAARSVVALSRREPGNLVYILQQSADDPQQFVFYELFRSDADLERHRRSPHVTGFLAAVDPILVPGHFILEKYVPLAPDEGYAPPAEPAGGSVSVLTFLRLKPGAEEQFREEVSRIVGPSRSEPGNLGWYVHESAEDPTLIVFYTRWVSPAALDWHLKSPPLAEYLRRTAPLLAAPARLLRFNPVTD